MLLQYGLITIAYNNKSKSSDIWCSDVKFPEIFLSMEISGNFRKISEKFSEEIFRKFWKFWKISGNFPEIFQKFSKHFRNFQICEKFILNVERVLFIIHLYHLFIYHFIHSIPKNVIAVRSGYITVTVCSALGGILIFSNFMFFL